MKKMTKRTEEEEKKTKGKQLDILLKDLISNSCCRQHICVCRFYIDG